MKQFSSYRRTRKGTEVTHEHGCDCAASYSHSHGGRQHLKEKKHHRLTHWMISELLISHLTVMKALTLSTHSILLCRGLCFSLYGFRQ